MAEWARLATTQITEYAKGVEDELMANRKLLAAIKSEGGMMYNCGGAGTDENFAWTVQKKEAPLQTDDFETPLVPTRKDYYARAKLPYIGYSMNDMMTKREKLLNRGSGTLVSHFEDMARRLMDSMTSRFSGELYVDVSGTGNSSRLSGIDSMMAYTQTVTISSGAARTANAADVVAYPADTYAGISTNLGGVSGTWGTQDGIATTWPMGQGDLAYDFWSPVIVNYDSDGFSPSTHTWDGQAEVATRFAITAMNRYGSDKGGLKTILFNSDLFRRLKDQIGALEKIEVTAPFGLRQLGFRDVIQLDGVDLTTEFGVPSAVGYGYNIKQVRMRSCQPRLFVTEGPWYEKVQRAHIVNVDFMGQIQFNAPRYFTKLALVAT